METKKNTRLGLCLQIAKFQTLLARRLDARLGGISFNELIILQIINHSPDKKIRRIDLAEKVGLTASGITRLLLPMEKIGLIEREKDDNDARVSYVKIAPGGLTKLHEGLERLEIYTEELIPENKIKKVSEITKLLNELEKNI